MLTAEEARRLFSYDRETGVLTRKTSPTNSVKPGDVAGCKNAQGYLQVNINGKYYRVHRIIFLIENGCWPEHEVDHVNGNRSDNRFCNLRCVTRRENNINAKRRSANTSGHTGVSWHKVNRKWTAQIRVNNKQIYLGCFTDLNDAIAARQAANIKYGFHPNHGR